MYCDFKLNDLCEESSINKLKTDALADIEKCHDEISATASNVSDEIDVIQRQDLLRYKEYDNLRCLPIGSVHRVVALGYIEHYGRERLVVKLGDKIYQAGEDLESKVKQITKNCFLQTEKVKLNHSNRIKFAVCSIYCNNDWTVFVKYNKTPFLKSFDGTTCVIDVRDTTVNGKKRKLILTDEGRIYRLKKSKIEDEIKPGYY